ncbi:MAG TPA: 16S rRNA (cytidine(1402)-2'-O)-methyltransferase [Actinobacteria bacterium]|nr:16S rRNA (cytidine(1402)-2'-O)-methyltransferase [Actinomycetota bacterium]HCK79542.1 16S rRNA (cytidine(1402)-2'-O)-methyltransferase [Actinomycetota bacterium]
MSGRLIIAGTPIGNPADAPERLREVLGSADIIAAEDTRRLSRLCRDLEVQPQGKVVSYFEGNEAERTDELRASLRQGAVVVLVTDAGMPLVSDPGYRLVRAAIDDAAAVTTLPGPSAALAALMVSGLPSDRFCVEGFLPRRAGERSKNLSALAAEPRTMIFFEAPHRLAAMLAAMVDAFGGSRQAAVCRELTKTHEEIVRGPLVDLAEHFAEGARGEITVVVEGATASGPSGTSADWATRVNDLQSSGLDRKAAIAQVMHEFSVSRRQVFDALVAAKRV